MNKIGSILLVLLIAVGSAAVFSSMGDSSDAETGQQHDDAGGIDVSESPVTTDTADIDEDSLFSDRDKVQTWDDEDATFIHLDDGGITTSEPEGVVVSGSTVTITTEGTYVLEGSLSDGHVVVDATAESKVQVVLNGVDITCSDNAAIFVAQADKVFLTLADGTTNTLSTGDSFCDDAEEEGIDGVIHSKDDLTITGSGTLVVNAAYDHGIVSKDDLVITGGTYVISSVGDGLKGKDCVAISDGTFIIDAGGDGIQSNEDEDGSKGYVYISGGTFEITADCDGIQAETILSVTGGDFDITTGGGYVNGAAHVANNMQNPGIVDPGVTVPGQFPLQVPEEGGRPFGDMGQGPVPPQSPATLWDGTEDEREDDGTTSAKGLKAGVEVGISGGTFVLNCADDAVHSNGAAVIAGGAITIMTGDDAVHAETNLCIEGGELTVLVCYEGLEGATVDITGGVISIQADDDGINAAGDGENYIHITGGVIFVQGDYDGLDSNGDLIIDGGELYVSGPDSTAGGICPGEEALDYGAEGGNDCVVNGGTVIAVGMYAMTEGFQDSSEQASFLYRFDTTMELSAGTEITVTDASGSVVVSYVAQKGFMSVACSSPALRVGETYTITAGNYSDSITLTGISTNPGAVSSGGTMPRR